MPIKPVEIMFGKIVPYVIVGAVQATLIVGIGVLLFGERLTRVQLFAVGLAGAAVILLSAGLGGPPLIAIGLFFIIRALIRPELNSGNPLPQ